MANEAGDGCEMPAVTLYRLKGGHTDLAEYANESAIGIPKNDPSNHARVCRPVAQGFKAGRSAVGKGSCAGRFHANGLIRPVPRDNALMVISIEEGGRVAYWAMAFGAAAWRWIEPSLVDREAPLVATFEVQRDPATGVVSGITSVIALDIARQAQRVTTDARDGQTYAAFENDADTRPVRGLKAKPTDRALGRTLRAGDGIHLTSIVDFDMAVEAVRILERAVRTGRAKGKAVPGITEVTRSALVARLDDMLVEAVKTGNAVSLVLPDVALERALAVEGSGRSTGIESFDLRDLRSELTAAGMLSTLDVATLAELELVDPAEIAAEPVSVWPYLEAALSYAGMLYFRADQLWYEAPANWLGMVNMRVDACRTVDSYPTYSHASENAYNEFALTPHLAPAVCLDRILTRAPGFERSGIEILDVLGMGTDAEGRSVLRFVAVKRGLRSADLSHLFTQVGTAADSLRDPVIRAAFLAVVRGYSPPPALLALAEDLLGPGRLYDTTRIEMIMAIVGKWGAKTVSKAVPVLGRAGLQRTIARLASLSHPVVIARVQTTAKAASVTKSAKKSTRKKSTSRKKPT